MYFGVIFIKPILSLVTSRFRDMLIEGFEILEQSVLNLNPIFTDKAQRTRRNLIYFQNKIQH